MPALNVWGRTKTESSSGMHARSTASAAVVVLIHQMKELVRPIRLLLMPNALYQLKDVLSGELTIRVPLQGVQLLRGHGLSQGN